jgi:cystathionine beta-lyase
VYYPGLVSHTGHQLAKKQMNGFGAMLSFELNTKKVNPLRFIRALRVIKPAVSLGGVESTICAPAVTSHAKISAAERRRIGISNALLRLSVGVEQVDDLIDDIQQAMKS